MIKSCAWILDSDEECGERTEGNTMFCASHNRTLRKEAETSRKQLEKREQLLKKAKEKSQQPRTKVKKVSPKREELNKEYKILADEYKRQHPECEIKANSYCNGKAESVHHTKGRISDRLLDTSTFKSACMSCHEYIHAHPKEAIDRGWSLSRLAKQEPHKI